MTDAVSGAGEERKGRTTGDSKGAHSPIVAPTETEAPDSRGPVTGRPAGVPRGAEEDRGERGERRESVPGAMTTPGRGRDAASDGVGGVGPGVGGSTVREGRVDREGHAGHAGHEEAQLLPHEECDKLSMRLQHAVAGFVDEPRSAVEEADHVLEEVAARFTDAVKQRRRTLRNSWQTGDAGQDKAVGSGDTEQLRLALRDYRELTERLLHS